jgi:hypothetical protein
VARDDEEAKEEWREYRTHTRKNVAWLLPQLVAEGARTLDELAPLVADDAEHPHLLDHLKQLGFYTDCLGNVNWSQPAELITQEIATDIVQLAEIFSNKEEATELEIELWVKHMQPVWKSEWMRQGLVNWHDDMVAHGLANDAGGMEKFVFGDGIGREP